MSETINKDELIYKLETIIEYLKKIKDMIVKLIY